MTSRAEEGPSHEESTSGSFLASGPAVPEVITTEEIRIRIAFLEQEIIRLESQQAQYANEIERLLFSHEPYQNVQEREASNDLLLLGRLIEAQQLHVELFRREHLGAVVNQHLESKKRKEIIEEALCFQQLEGGKDSRETKYPKTDSLNLEPDMVCSICLDGFSSGQVLACPRNEACNHRYHADCLTSWLQSHSQCPICREVIVPDS